MKRFSRQWQLLPSNLLRVSVDVGYGPALEFSFYIGKDTAFLNVTLLWFGFGIDSYWGD